MSTRMDGEVLADERTTGQPAVANGRTANERFHGDTVAAVPDDRGPAYANRAEAVHETHTGDEHENAPVR